MFLWRLFSTPDAFERRPWAYARNQLGHMALGALLAWLLPLWTALAIPVAWEAAQRVLFGAELHDGLEDTGFFFVGAFAFTEPTFAALGGVFLLAGVARRNTQTE